MSKLFSNELFAYAACRPDMGPRLFRSVMPSARGVALPSSPHCLFPLHSGEVVPVGLMTAPEEIVSSEDALDLAVDAEGALPASNPMARMVEAAQEITSMLQVSVVGKSTEERATLCLQRAMLEAHALLRTQGVDAAKTLIGQVCIDALFRGAIDSPLVSSTHDLLGYFNLADGNATRAIACFRQAGACRAVHGALSGWDPLLNQMGVLYFLMGEHRAAVDHFEAGVEAVPALLDVAEGQSSFVVQTVRNQAGVAGVNAVVASAAAGMALSISACSAVSRVRAELADVHPLAKAIDARLGVATAAPGPGVTM